MKKNNLTMILLMKYFGAIAANAQKEERFYQTDDKYIFDFNRRAFARIRRNNGLQRV